MGVLTGLIDPRLSLLPGGEIGLAPFTVKLLRSIGAESRVYQGDKDSITDDKERRRRNHSRLPSPPLVTLHRDLETETPQASKVLLKPSQRIMRIPYEVMKTMSTEAQ